MKYQQRPIEAFTFAELVEHGKANGGNIVNGMPWSFEFRGHPITHENDDCYLIPTREGLAYMQRDDMLIVEPTGDIWPCIPDIFAVTFERVIDSANVCGEVPRKAGTRGACTQDPN